jgi:hypothetical protein
MIAITCRKCGQKFDRKRKNERVCMNCKPNWQKALRAAKDSAHTALPGRESPLVSPQVSPARIRATREGLLAHEPDCPCGPCSACRPPEYRGRPA